MKNKIMPVTFDELKFALSLGSSAAEHKTPIENPETKKLHIVDDETGEVDGTISLVDNAINRFSGAIAKEFGQDEKIFVSIMSRAFELSNLVEDDRMKPYVIDDGGGEIGIHDSVIELLATIPMSLEDKINKDEFFDQLKSIKDE